MRIWIFVGFLFLALIAIISSVEGVSFVVDDDNGTWADYGSISEALNDAPEGSTIYIYNGTYEEEINTGKEFTIIGNGSSDTKVDANGSDVVMTLNGNGTFVSGLHLKGPAEGDEVVSVSAENVTIEDCVFGSNSDPSSSGLMGHGSHNLTIRRCTWKDRERGVKVRDAVNILIEDCNGSSNDKGIIFDNVQNATISNNDLWRNEYGIWLRDGCSDVTIEDNNVDDSGENGIEIRMDCNNITIFDNDLLRADRIAINLTDTGDVLVEDNYIFDDHTDNMNGVRLVRSEDCTIHNNTIEAGNAATAVLLEKYSHRCNISDNVIYSGRHAIRVNVSNGCLIEDNWIHNNSGIGLHIERSNRTDVHGNVIADGTSSRELMMIENCYDLNITKNNLSRNEDRVAIYIDETDDVWFENNTVAWSQQGLYARSSDNITIVYNEFINNTYYGVSFSGSTTNCLVHHNNFYGNYDNDGQAYDSASNDWDDGSEGNWWSDWDGNGTYEIDGSGQEDGSPFAEPVETGAPEKVPEIGLLLTVASLAFLAVFIRRRYI